MQTAQDKIFRRIRRKPVGYAFSAKYFLDVGSRGGIDMALSALLHDGVIRRVGRGVYLSNLERSTQLLERLFGIDCVVAS